MNEIFRAFKESIEVKKNILDNNLALVIEEMAEESCSAIVSGKKIIFCGNGGSAADAQHLAAELLIRFRSSFDRPPIKAISLALDSSTITACGNDYDFDLIYSRTLEALGDEGDILFILSTSGMSKNILNAIESARKKNIAIFSFLGNDGGKAKKNCTLNFIVPCKNTARIQESHITAGHAFVEMLENKLVEIGYL